MPIRLYAFLDALLRVLVGSRAQLAPTKERLCSRARETPKQKHARLQESVVDLRENLIKHISNIYVKISNNDARQDALAGKESHHSESTRSQEICHSVSLRHYIQFLSCACDECASADQPKDPADHC